MASASQCAIANPVRRLGALPPRARPHAWRWPVLAAAGPATPARQPPRRAAHPARYGRSSAVAAATSAGPTFNIQSMEVEYGGRKIKIETGEIGRQAAGAVTVTDGETVVYTTACAAESATSDGSFGVPLQVTYAERFSAAGRTSGSFIKRDGRPKDHETLTARLIDRPLRPAFPAGWASDTQVLAWVLSYDGMHGPEPLAITAAGAALAVSDVPLARAVAGVRVGLLPADTSFEGGAPPGVPSPCGRLIVVNPTVAQMANSCLDLVVAGTAHAVLMIEGYCDFLSDDTMAAAVGAGADAVAAVAAAVDGWAESVGARPKRADRVLPDPGLADAVRAAAAPALAAAYSAPRGKADLSAAVAEAKAAAAAAVGLVPGEPGSAARPPPTAASSSSDDEDGTASTAAAAAAAPPSYPAFSAAFKAVQSAAMRSAILGGGARADGRAPGDVRPIASRAGLLPRTHGSALFTRGETQALAVATLGPTTDAQRVDGIGIPDDGGPAGLRRFYLQYFFPPSSVGETGRVGTPGRREIGHGTLAERALAPAVPAEEDFPYTVRVESTITESNGSSSMASVCGGCLAMLDAGVPLATPVAGVAMGLILEQPGEGGGGDGGGGGGGADAAPASPPRAVVLTDILGSEDALGDMDFKVAGDADRITAFQMDIKVEGVTLPIIRAALAAAAAGRRHILSAMEGCAPPPRRALAPHAPRIVRLTIPTDKVGVLIGPGGRTIRAVMADSGCGSVQVIDSEAGLVELCDPDPAAVAAAAAAVRALTTEPEAGAVYRGAKVASVEKFGLICEFAPGRTGLCHVSELGPGGGPDGYEVGDRVDVVLLEASDNRFKLSRRAALALDGLLDDDASSAGSAPTPPPPPPPPLEVGQVLRGATVNGVSTFGVFVDVGGGRSGLVHVSELAPGPDEDGNGGGGRRRRSAAANEAALARYAKGDAVDVVVTRLGDDGKISLSERAVLAGGDGSVWAESDGFGDGGEDGPGTPTRASEGARRR